MSLSTRSRGARMIAWVLLAGSFAGGCRSHRATVEDCRAVLDRLVELELAESGFRDPALTDRWKGTLRARLAPTLVRCQGRRVPADLRSCLAAAHGAEEVTHRCLR